MSQKKKASLSGVLTLGALGLLGGGIAGTGVTLASHLNNMKERSKLRPKNEDRTVIEVPVPRRRIPEPPVEEGIEKESSTGATLALGIPAAAIGALGGYVLPRKLYQGFHKRDMQKQLEAAQKEYYYLLNKRRVLQDDPEAYLEKESSADNPNLLSWFSDKGKSFWRNIGGPAAGGLGGLALLLALGTGVGAYHYLDRNTPAIKRPEREKPKPKIKFVEVDAETYEPIKPEDREKYASADNYLEITQDDQDALVFEHMFRTVLGDEKRAYDSGLLDLVGLVAKGHIKKAQQIILDNGIDEVFEFSKEAHTKDIPKKKVDAAISLISKTAGLREAFGPVIAAEFVDMSPTMFFAAAESTPEEREELEKIAATYMLQTKHEMMKDWFPSKGSVNPDTFKNLSTKSAGILSGLLYKAIMAPTREKTIIMPSGDSLSSSSQGDAVATTDNSSDRETDLDEIIEVETDFDIEYWERIIQDLDPKSRALLFPEYAETNDE